MGERGSGSTDGWADRVEDEGTGAFPEEIDAIAAGLMQVPARLPEGVFPGLVEPERPKELDRWLRKARRRRERSLTGPGEDQFSAEVRRTLAELGLDIRHPGVAFIVGVTARALEFRPRDAIKVLGDVAARSVEEALAPGERVADAMVRFGIQPVHERVPQLRML